jgi:hypothetical protein
MFFFFFVGCRICFTSSKEEPFDLEENTGGLELIVCGAEDAASVYKATASSLLSNSMDVDVDLTGLLIWQTRAEADANKTSQSAVIDYALKIREHQFPGTNLEVIFLKPHLTYICLYKNYQFLFLRSMRTGSLAMVRPSLILTLCQIHLK